MIWDDRTIKANKFRLDPYRKWKYLRQKMINRHTECEYYFSLSIGLLLVFIEQKKDFSRVLNWDVRAVL